MEETYKFKCQFGGCGFKGEFPREDIIGHFQKEHPTIEYIPMGKATWKIPKEEETKAPDQPFEQGIVICEVCKFQEICKVPENLIGIDFVKIYECKYFEGE